MTHRLNILAMVAILLLTSSTWAAGVKEKQLDPNYTAEVFKRGGTVTATGAFNMGGYKITNAATGTDPGDLVTRSQLDAVAGGIQVKQAVEATTDDVLLEDNVDIASVAYDPDGATAGTGRITATLNTSGDFTVDGYQTVNGNRILVVWEGSGDAEVMSVDTVADVAGSLNNTYWVFYTNASKAYYVWYNVNSGGTDPAPTPPTGVSYTGIEVAIATGATANAVATATKAAIEAVTGIEVTVGTVTTNDLTLTNAFGGNVTNVAEGVGTGFTFATDTQGTGLCPDANGIYSVSITGTSLVMDRTADANADGELPSGSLVFVQFGTVHEGVQFVLSSPNPVIVGGDGGTSQVWTYWSNLNLADAGEMTTVNAGDTAAGGSSGNAARGDHQHAVSTAAPATQTLDGANTEGTATSLARSDHLHNIAAAVVGSIVPDATAAEGTSNSVARADHTHGIVGDTAGSIVPDATAAEGTATSFSRSDHVHGIAAAVAGTIAPDDTAAEGTSTSFARADHVHTITADTAVSVGTANAEGNASTFARSNHVHDSGVAVTSNKQAAPSNTTGDDADSGLTIAATPANDAYVTVTVNGVQYPVGDGVDTQCSYFADPGAPTTPKTIATIAASDKFIWNGTTCGFNLQTTDIVSFFYESM